MFLWQETGDNRLTDTNYNQGGGTSLLQQQQQQQQQQQHSSDYFHVTLVTDVAILNLWWNLSQLQKANLPRLLENLHYSVLIIILILRQLHSFWYLTFINYDIKIYCGFVYEGRFHLPGFYSSKVYIHVYV